MNFLIDATTSPGNLYVVDQNATPNFAEFVVFVTGLTFDPVRVSAGATLSFTPAPGRVDVTVLTVDASGCVVGSLSVCVEV